MSRLTEMIDFLNVEPRKLAVSKSLYTHFFITETAKEIRREYTKELKKANKNNG